MSLLVGTTVDELIVHLTYVKNQKLTLSCCFYVDFVVCRCRRNWIKLINIWNNIDFITARKKHDFFTLDRFN